MNRRFELTSAALHVMAMLFMLLDHMWATVTPGNPWMTCVGRIAFPIFAFMIVEGFFHTRNYRRYLLRLLVLAVVSEIPFNLMYGAQLFYPYHQNVIWTFLIALLVMGAIEKLKGMGKPVLTVLGSAVLVLVSVLLGFVTMVDYYGVGVATVLIFYFFRGRKWWCFAGQVLLLGWLNLEVLGGLYYPVMVLGFELELLQQGFAMLALIPIWLYRGRQGYHSRWFQLTCYAFYPAHILILALLMLR